MNNYRDTEVEQQIERLEKLLTDISEKRTANLGVAEILQESPLMPFEEAVIRGMKKTANEALIHSKALAMGFDRVIAMFEQMLQDIEKIDKSKAQLYKNRLPILTNFVKIMDELNPEKVRYFAHQK